MKKVVYLGLTIAQWAEWGILWRHKTATFHKTLAAAKTTVRTYHRDKRTPAGPIRTVPATSAASE